MSYSLKIGEAELEYEKEDLFLRISAKLISSPNAPDHDRYIGQTNERSPSYSGWHEFCREVDLETLFFGSGWSREQRCYLPCPEGYHRENPLIKDHPGYAVLCNGDLSVIRAARENRERTNNNKPPGFYYFDKKTMQDVPNNNDPQLARLLWLEFWVEWALQNCSIPIIANS